MPEEKLKPCPFCGSHAILEDYGPVGHPIYKPSWDVVCTGCKAQMENFGTKQQAITAWNTRTYTKTSGCACKFDGDGETLLVVCDAHKAWNTRK